MLKIKNKETKVVLLLSVVAIVAIVKSYIFPYQHPTSAFEFHISSLGLMSEGDEVYIGKNVFELLEGKYWSVQQLSKKGLICLNDFKPKTETGASSKKLGIKIKTKKKDLYYQVYLYSDDYFYLGPYRLVNGRVQEQLKLLKVNCNYSSLLTY